ncbi:MAG: hypothetical protein WCF10_02235, partial [Polyangiales bacterium]
LRALAARVEFDPNLARQCPEKPKGMILRSLHVQLPALDTPIPARLLVVLAELGPLEIISESGPNPGIPLRRTGSDQQEDQR